MLSEAHEYLRSKPVRTEDLKVVGAAFLAKFQDMFAFFNEGRGSKLLGGPSKIARRYDAVVRFVPGANSVVDLLPSKLIQSRHAMERLAAMYADADSYDMRPSEWAAQLSREFSDPSRPPPAPPSPGPALVRAARRIRPDADRSASR